MPDKHILPDLFKELKDLSIFKELLPNFVYNHFQGKDCSLYDIIFYDSHLFSQSQSIGQGKIMKFKEFQSQFTDEIFVNEFICQVESNLIEYKLKTCEFEDAIELKFDFDLETNIIELLNQYVIQLYNELIIIESKLPIGNYRKALKRQLGYLRLYFGIEGPALSFSEIAVNYSKSPESIRVDLYALKENGFNLEYLSKGLKHFYGLRISNELGQFIQASLENSVYQLIPDDSIQRYTQTKINNLLSLYKYSLHHEDLEGYSPFTLVPDDTSLYFGSHLRLLTKVLKKGNPLPKEKIKTAMIDELKLIKSTPYTLSLKKKGIDIQVIDSILQYHFKIERIGDDQEETLYRLSWPFLSSIEAKATYVLYNVESNLSLEELKKRFTELNVLYQCSEIDSFSFVLKRTEYIEPIGRLGRWQYVREGKPIADTNSYLLHLKQILEEKFFGKATFDQIIAAVDSANFTGYPELSTRTYLNTFARRAKENPNLFIHEDYVSQYSGIEVQAKRNKNFQNAAFNSVVDILKEKEPLSKNELTQLVLDDLENKGYRIVNKYMLNPIIQKCKGYNLIEENLDESFCLVLTELEKIDLKRIGLQREPEYKTRLKSEVIEYLKTVRQATLSDLKLRFINLIPNNIAPNIFYKILGSEPLLQKLAIDSSTFYKLLIDEETYSASSTEENTEDSILSAPVIRIYERPRFNVVQMREEVAKLLVDRKDLGFSSEELMKGFDAFYQILRKNGVLAPWADVLLQSLYQVICSKSDRYDMYLCMIQLITSYETFIKRLISKCEFVKGQSDVIAKIPQLRDLGYYRNLPREHRTNTRKLKFSYVLSSLIFLSNKYRHDRDHESLDLTFTNEKDVIVDYLGLYLYTAMVTQNSSQTVV